MFECVFTTQKNKKKKKWEDGFIEKKGKGILLYNENRKMIFKSEKYSITEEMYLESGQYLIYSEDMTNDRANQDEKIECDNNIDNNIDGYIDNNIDDSINDCGKIETDFYNGCGKIETDIGNDCREIETDIGNDCGKIDTNGRSKNEILNLFNKS